MRKRLIERLTHSKQGSLGYTLTEMLVVIAIIAIACAIAIPSIFYLRDMLRFAQANNYAKSIFLAAQQNLTELRSDGGLGPVQKITESTGGAVNSTFPEEYAHEYYYISSDNSAMSAAYNMVLPAHSIDGTLRGDHIIIEYNPYTGNVYSVFYSEKTDVLSMYHNSGELALPRDAEGDKAKRRELMVGYYDGSGLNSSQIELEQTQAIVEFVNGQEGIVRVKIPMPESYFGDFDSFAAALDVDLSITGELSIAKAAEQNEAVVPMNIRIKSAGSMTGCKLDVDGKTVIVEYALDSLANRSSFVNFLSDTQKKPAGEGISNDRSLTTILEETEFLYTVLPGENITIQADVTFQGTGEDLIRVAPGIISGVNPMFESMLPGTTDGRFVLTLSNGRNLQNLNAIAPTIAKQVEAVIFNDDIYWNDTVSYYNDKYAGGSTYHTNTAMAIVDGVEKAVYDEAPARALPYFVPIHNEDLFGTARFMFPGMNGDVSEDGGLFDYIWGEIKDFGEDLLHGIGGFTNNSIPTLTDELDLAGTDHATIHGNGHKVLNLRIDSTKYQIPNVGRKEQISSGNVNEDPITVDYTGTFYATGELQLVDYAFTGLFGYVNTPIDDLHVVNPIIKGYPMTYEEKSIPQYITIGPIKIPGNPKIIKTYNNPATGALVGASGYNTWITNCSTYIDKDARGYMNLNWGPEKYSKDAYQSWYGVMGEGAVGGLVGYAKSHLNTTGQINGKEVALAFADCFAAVPVSGNMRGYNDKQFGYSNGVGGFIGNSQLTNFYNCYSSGDVYAENVATYKTDWLASGVQDGLKGLFGISLDLLYTGRTSMGAGGFVGSSHGTRYTNCFASGNVDAHAYPSLEDKYKKGGGGFVGFMSIDEVFGYGHGNASVEQRTVFTNCYSVGKAVTDNKTYENFSGANGRIAFMPTPEGSSVTYIVGDYFRLYAPYYYQEGKDPEFGVSTYIYRDSYFLSGYHEGGQDSSGSCASPDTYSFFEDMVGNHAIGTAWMTSEINEIKNIGVAWKWAGIGDSLLDPSDDVYVITETYQTRYFDNLPTLDGIYRDLYNAGYSSLDWNSATASTTHPYSLTAGQRYPFTKLIGLDYYGDWPSKPSDVGMAYFETYHDTGKTHYFFDKSHTENASLTLREGETVFVSKDGYAIFSANNADLTVTISDNDASTADISDTLKVVPNEIHTVNNKAYHVFRLSDRLVNALPSDGEFYVKVTAQHTGTSDTYTMYFNPNVAMSHVNPVEGKKNADKPDAAPTTVYIRSARQLKGIATLDDFWGDGYRYIQQLNIDAAVWADQNKDIKLTSVGTSEKPFNAAYSAGYTVDNNGVAEEKQYKITGFTPADGGIFGVIGEKGSVSDVTVEFSSDITAGNAELDSIAILAGVNGGTIDNVKLELKGNVTLTAKTNTGLLAGLSTGSVIDCTVSASKNVTLTASNAGGLIGSAAGVAERRAQVTGSTLSIEGTVNIGTAVYAGGLMGSADQTAMENCSVGMKALTTQAEWAGGLAGYAEDSSFVGSSEVNLKEVWIDETLSAKGTASGVLGNARNVTMTGMDLFVKSVSGASAQGFLGNGVNVDPSNCTVKITQAVTGQTGAAGVAGSIGEDSVFNRVSADLTGVTISATAGDAAGYALEIKAQAMVMGQSSITFDDTAISASGTAAGYACVLNGTVGDVTAAGKGRITGANAAGFAAQINGNVESVGVTPARNQNDYLGNSNANLTVTGTDSAAGFALVVGSKGAVSNSYTLCTVSSSGTIQIEKEPEAPAETTEPSETSETTETTETTAPTEPPMEAVTSAYGFVGTSDGTINRCMANVDIAGGFGFVGINNGLISSCYGWYSDGVADSVTAARGLMSGDGRCNNSYFAMCENSMRASEAVLVYDDQGIGSPATLNMLQGLSLNGFTIGYDAWPYTPMNPEAYPYPMLRDHYGNWVTPPEYAYGVAYYEKYSDGTVRLHMEDLSNSVNTMEQTDLSYRDDVFDNHDQITEAGYAMFYNAAAGNRDGNIVLTKEIDGFTYNFYAIETEGEYPVPVTTDQTRAALLDTRFADAIVVGAEAFGADYSFQVRTPEQLARIGDRTASYSQTHDISTTDVTTASIADGKTYDGNNLKLTINGQTQSWLNTVNGTVTNLNLEVTDAVNAPIFGTVSGTVSLNSVKLASIQKGGALVASAGGTVTLPGITVSGSVDGNVIETVSGTVNVGPITTGTVSGSIFANAASGTLETGSITTDAVTGSIFGAVSSNVTTGAITTKQIGSADAPAKIFGNITGGMVQVSTVSTGDVFGNVFSNVAANTTVSGGITTGQVTGNVFGVVTGTVKTGTISTQQIGLDGQNTAIIAEVGNNGSVTAAAVTTNGCAVNGNVFGNVNGSVNVSGGINTGSVSGNVFGAVGANVTVGGIETGALGGNLILSLTNGTVTTGDITLASRTAPLVGTFTGGILRGDAGTRKTISIGDLDEAPNAIVFSQTVDGSIQNYTYSTDSEFAGLASQMSGSLSGVTVTVDGNTQVPFLGTMDGPVNKVHFTVTGNAAAALITTQSGSMQSSEIRVSSASNGLIGTVGANMTSVTLAVDGTMNGSAIGESSALLDNVTLRAENVSAKGGVLVGSNGGSFADCEVNVTNVTASGANFGIVADKLDQGKTLDATVNVGTLSFTAKVASNVGGLVGSNAGKITGSTVTIQAAKPVEAEQSALDQLVDLVADLFTVEKTAENATQGVTLNGAAEFQTTFGGLTGSNSGTISGSKANVDVTYVQPNDVTTDKAVLGGLVGTMSGGSITGTGNSDATGSITLTGNAKGRAYVVGGAVGSDLGATYTNVAVTTLIGENWAGASVLPNAENPMATGPIGMFTGYVTTGNYNTCASTAPNSTYQFLGQIQIVQTALPASTNTKDWFGHKSNTGNNTYPGSANESLAQNGEKNQFIAHPDGYLYNDLTAKLDKCSFTFSDVTYTQTIQNTEFFHLGEKLTFAAGYNLAEMTTGSPFDKMGSKCVITNEAGTYMFNGSANGVAIPTRNSKGYFTAETYNTFAQWTSERNTLGYNLLKYNNQYIYLYYNDLTARYGTSVVGGLKIRKVTNGYTIEGMNRYLVSSGSNFATNNNAGTLKLWTVVSVPESYDCTFNYQNLTSKTCVAVNGNEILQPNN